MSNGWNYTYEFTLEYFTKYINSVLRKKKEVIDWAFTIDRDMQNALILRIDFIKNRHSRSCFNMYRDLDSLKMEFDMYLEEFLDELIPRGIKAKYTCCDEFITGDQFDYLLNGRNE